MKKRLFLITAIGLLAIILTGILFFRDPHNYREIEDVPEPYVTCLKAYLSAMEHNPKDAFQYAYFPNDFYAEAFLNSNITFLEYQIKDHQRINDSLYEFTCTVKDSVRKDHSVEVYYFVGKIMDKYVFIGNAKFVPDELSMNLDIAQFSYTGEEYL